MKRTLFVAAALSAAAALAACDNASDPATTSGTPNPDGTVTMPSPAPENTAPPTGGTLGDGTGTMGGSASPGGTTAP